MAFDKTNKKGFTLMELLVTVILVAVLATYAVYYYTDIMREGEVNAAKGKLAALGGATARYILEKGEFLQANDEIEISEEFVAQQACGADNNKAKDIFRCGYAEKSLGFDDHFDFYFSRKPCGINEAIPTTVFMEPKDDEDSDVYPACAYFDPDQDKVIVGAQ